MGIFGNKPREKLKQKNNKTENCGPANNLTFQSVHHISGLTGMFIEELGADDG